MRRSVLIVGAALGVLAVASARAQGPGGSGPAPRPPPANGRAVETDTGPRVTLEGRDVDLRRAIVRIARMGGYGVAIDADVAGVLDLQLRDEPWAKALVGVLRPRGLHAVIHGSVLAVSRREPSEEPSVVSGLPARHESVWVNGPFDSVSTVGGVHLGDADLRDAIESLARSVGQPIMVEPGVHECINLELGAVPWPDALAAVARQGHCRLRRLPDLIVVERARTVPDTRRLDSAAPLLRKLAAEARASLVIDEDAFEASIFVDFDATDWESVLKAIVDASGLRLARRGEIAVVASHVLVGPAHDLWPAWWERPAPLPTELVTRSWELASVSETLGAVSGNAGRRAIVASEGGQLAGDLFQARWFDVVQAVALASGFHVSELTPGVVGVSAVAHGSDLEKEPPTSAWRAPGDARHRVRLSLEDAPLAKVVAAIAGHAGREITVSPGGPDTDLTLELPPVDWQDALDDVARESGRVIRREATGRLTLEPPPRFTVVTSGVTAAAWFELLGKAAGQPIDVAPWLDRLGGVCAVGVEPETLLRATAEQLGADVSARREGGWRLTRRSTTPAAPGQVRLASRREPLPAREMPRVLAPDEIAALVSRLDASVKELCKTADEEQRISPDPDFVARIDRESFRPILMLFELELREAGAAGADLVRDNAARWREQLGNHRELAFAITLEVAFLQGQELLGALDHAKQDERWDDIPGAKQALDRHVESMLRRSPRDEMKQQADRLVLHGREIVRSATKLQELRERFPVHLKAFAIDERAGGRSRAVLSVEGPRPRESVYEVGDELRDWQGQRLPVRVKAIAETGVTLTSDGVDFNVRLDTAE